jgi:2-hydroxy-6-oxonona-2,4-dienedioate hydrolase
MVGTLMAALTPARVRLLVLSGAPALGVNPEFRLVLRAWGGLTGNALGAAHRHNLATLMLARPDSIDALALTIHARNLARDRMKLRRLSRTRIVLETLPQVRCPVVGIWGAEDVLYRGVADRLAPALASAPDFRWLEQIPGAGHWVQYEDWEAYDARLAQALAEGQSKA